MPYLTNKNDAALRIRELLNQRPGACRRLIQAFLVFGYGFHPYTVTAALEAVRDDPDNPAIWTQFRNAYGGRHCEMYSTGNPDPAFVLHLEQLYARMRSAVPNELTKRAGEEYVRAILSHSGRFEGITQRQRLGQVRNGRPLTLDLAATDRQTGARFAISVKNQSSFLRQDAPSISDCFNRARLHQARPWLFVPFATPEAINRCQRDGIRLTVLGRQLLPAETDDHQVLRWIIPSFRPDIIGDQPLDFVYRRFAKTRAASLLVERDLLELLVGEADQAA